MAKVLILALVYFWLSTISCYLLQSDYEKTQVIEDDYLCVKEEDKLHKLFGKKTRSLITCSNLCSSVEDCRRVLYDLETRTCTLYNAGENCLTDGDIHMKVCYKQKSLCSETTCPRCPIGYHGDRCEHVIQDCSDGARLGVVPYRMIRSHIKPSSTDKPIEVTCEFQWGGLTYIHSRSDNCREVDFNRTWQEYSDGFGTIMTNYWIGLRHVHQMLQNYASFSLTVDLKLKSESVSSQGQYRIFQLGDVSTNYTISIGYFIDNSYKGCGDSLIGNGYNINGRPFSTYDRDHTSHNCPGRFHGGWWYLDNLECSRANMVGLRTGRNFEETWHWQRDMGNTTDYLTMILYIKRL